MKKTKKKNKKWMRPRHRLVTALLRLPMRIYCRLKYGARVDKFKEQGKRPYLIMMNHQTAFDQFFVGLSFRGPVYYVASEDLFSKGWLSSLIRFLVEPIPIRKSMTDVRAVINCMKVAKEGGTIAIAPEGNRTFSGETVYIKPAIAQLAKALKLPIAIYRIEGGYGVHPRFSDKVRHGRMHTYVSAVIEPEEYGRMSDEELLDRIQTALYYNEHEHPATYRHKRCAEYIERVMYFCPHCGLSAWESQKDTVRCLRCGMTARYLPDLTFAPVHGDFPYRDMGEWYRAQEAFMHGLDLTPYLDTPMYTDRADFAEVIVYKKKQPIEKNVTLSLYGDRLLVKGEKTEMEFPFSEVTAMSVLGRNKLNIYVRDRIWQVKGDPRFNPVKYMNTFYHYTNIRKGEDHGEHEFLGL